MIDVNGLSEEEVRQILQEIIELRQKAWAEAAGSESSQPATYDSAARVWRNAEGYIVFSQVEKIRIAEHDFFNKVGHLLGSV